ncbi:DUF1559 domain-containing protein [Telmatocola sphagniphila]|uniref:DUF1559 domain-containing protein n=1 Tax=Telmatocola sphagniphila TaxID=1123043 RepID=A0A8E6ETF2_9BACT|nr:DUF1559 domain-containing protein [Telmatocola sphagniphila]QVL30010.1 DUF1559 domain-containing protein [Telmatocola sphagniphila]
MFHRFLLLTSVFALGWCSSTRAQTNTVPADAAIYAKINAKQFLDNPVLKPLLETISKADPALLADFQKRYPVTPLDISGVTVFALANPNPQGPPIPFGLIHMSKDVGPASVLALVDPKAQAKAVGGTAYFESQALQADIQFLDNRTVLVGAAGTLQMLAQRKAGKGALAEIIGKSETLPDFFFAIDASIIPADAKQGIPPDFQPIAALKTLQISGDSKTNNMIIQMNFASEAATKSAHEALLKAISAGRSELAKAKQEMMNQMSQQAANQPAGLEGMATAVGGLLASGGFNQIDAFLANPGLVVKGEQITKTIEMPDMMGINGATMPVLVGLLLPAVQKVRAAAGQAQGTNNVKQMILAFHNFESAYGFFPNDICDKNGKPLLSWRVAILPYIEQANLYNQFKLDEPWDSEHNKPLSEIVVKIFCNPNDPDVGPKTHYQVFTGKDTCFVPGKKLNITNITDGTSNTGIVFEAKEAVVWTKPGDIAYSPKMDVASKLLFRNGQSTTVGMADGSVRMIDKNLSARTWHLLINPADGEVLNLDARDTPERSFPKPPVPKKQ